MCLRCRGVAGETHIIAGGGGGGGGGEGAGEHSVFAMWGLGGGNTVFLRWGEGGWGNRVFLRCIVIKEDDRREYGQTLAFG